MHRVKQNGETLNSSRPYRGMRFAGISIPYHLMLFIPVCTVIVLGSLYATQLSVDRDLASKTTSGSATDSLPVHETLAMDNAPDSGKLTPATTPAPASQPPATNKPEPSEITPSTPSLAQVKETPASQNLPAQPVCDNAQKTAALEERQMSIKEENSEHQSTLSSMKRRYLFQRLFSPDSFDKRIDDEDGRHNAVIDTINKTYLAAVAVAHCQ